MINFKNKKMARNKIESVSIEEVKKTKWKKNKMEMEKLKQFIFEKSSYGWTHKEIADATGYTRENISKINQQINDEYLIELKQDKNKLIVKELNRLEWITKKLYKELEKLEWWKNINKMIALHNEILKTNELLMKLQGLLVDKVQVNSDLSKEEMDEFNELFE